MLKRYMIAALALVGLVSHAWAQDWTGKGNTVAAGDYYLYNVKSGKYLTWGTNWSSRASLVENAGEIATLTLSEGKYKIAFNGMTSNTKGLFLNGDKIPFCDNVATAFSFVETSSGSKVYRITDGTNYFACRTDFSAEPSPVETITDGTSDRTEWMLISRQDRIDALADATADNPMDATFYINGAEINDLFNNADAWEGTDPTFNGRTGDLEATGFAAENYWGANVESYQTLTGLPAGKYRLSCYGFYRDGSATDAGTKYANGTEDIKAYLFAGANQTPLSSIMVGANTSNDDGGVEASSGKWVPNDMAQAVLYFFRGRYPAVTVDAIVGDDGQLKIGVCKDAGTEQKWTIWDRFRLTYYGDDLTSYAEALEAAVTAANNFIALDVVPTAAEEAIGEVVAEQNKTYTKKADYISATTAINDVVAQYNTEELKSAYAAYKTMRTHVQTLENTETYKYTDTGTAKSTFDGAISSANTAVETATTADAINTQISYIRAAALTFVSSVTAEDGNPFNLTFLASTAAADWQTASGLNAAATAPAWSVPKPDASMADFVESYTEAAGGESITGNILYQTLSGMPAGYYTVALYAAASYTPTRGSLVEKCTDGQPNITFGFAGGNTLSLPVVHRTSLTAADQVPVNLSVQLASAGDLTFGIKKNAAGSNWHVAQIYTITYSSKDPDLTVLKADRDALVSEANGLLASDDADLLTTAQQNALSTAISTAESANTFEALTEVTLTTLPNAIQTARQQIQTVKENRVLMLAALERFENNYNLADGTDYSRATMSAAAWTTLINKVNAVITALDDVSQASNYGTVKDALIDQMDATDASLRLFKSYKAMVEGTTDLGIVGSYGADGNMDDDDNENAAITALNTAFVNYAVSLGNSVDMAAFLGENLDFSAAEGDALNTDNSNSVYGVAGWEVEYADADTWAVIQTQHNDHQAQLYMRKNWGSAATVLRVVKQRMLPVGKYSLSFSWNSDMANMTNLSQYRLGESATTIGESTNEAKTLTYDVEVTDTPKPFDLVFGFQKTGKGNTPAQIVVDDVTLTYYPTVATVTFAPEGFATYYNGGFDVTLPAGMKARIVTDKGATEGALVYETIADGDGEARTVPAGTAVLLQVAPTAEPQSLNITLVSPTATAISQTNYLKGSDEDFTPTETGYLYYKLTYGDDNTEYADVFGWYWGATDGAAFENPAHKAYLVLENQDPAPGGGNAKLRFFGLPDGESMGIEGIAASSVESKGAWFTLSGIRLNAQPTAKGIYIRDGKKFVVR